MVILISSVQLALLLFAVISLFSWFTEKADSTLSQQACTDNQAIGRQVAKNLRESGLTLSAIQEAPGQLDALTKLIGHIHMPNYGFITLLTVDGEKPLASFPAYPNLETNEILDSTFVTLEGKSYPLRQSVNSACCATQGELQFAGHRHFASVEWVEGIGLLVVAQQRSNAIQDLNAAVGDASKTFYAATLLIGLACVCSIVVILNRMTAKVNHLNEGLEQKVSAREKQLVRTKNAVIFGLAKLAESRDNDTGEHLDRIRSYVMILSEDLKHRMEGVDDQWVHNIALASSLHDVGKVGIPDSILLKPGRLTREEREVMELHTLIGGECLEAIQNRLGNDDQFMQIAQQIAYYHHERWDGAGYPHGLKEEQIPLVARIVAVADVYDALTSKRPYKNPLSHIESKGIILAGSGSQFDPNVVDAFLRHEDEFEAISRVQADLKDEDVLSDFHLLFERAQCTHEDQNETASV